MEELKLYAISDKYISYLQKSYPNIYSNKEENRKHTRKYVGTVVVIGGHNYYIPLSSPKDSDYQFAGDKKVIKKSIVPIMRIVIKNVKGEKELKGTLRISHMIPVPKSELELYDMENETDVDYKALVQNEIIFIRKNKDKIIANANLLYKQKNEDDISVGYTKIALPFKELEKLCEAYLKNL